MNIKSRLAIVVVAVFFYFLVYGDIFYPENSIADIVALAVGTVAMFFLVALRCISFFQWILGGKK